MGSNLSANVEQRPARLQSVDLVRGVVIVLMALDHARHFFSAAAFDPTDPQHTTAAYFFTRWVTHFCAPAFSLLAGTSAWFQRAAGKSPSALARFLVSRGLWLVLLELTVLRVAWSWGFDLAHPALITIWALGWSMVVLAPLVFLPTWVVGALAVVMICGHNAFDGIHATGWLRIFHDNGAVNLGGLSAWVVYPLVPWIAVMPLGYALGPLFRLPEPRRQRLLAALGVGLIGAFIVLRSINGYGDPHRDLSQLTGVRHLLSFLNVTKYPPSLLYLLVTLGGTFLLLAAFDRLRVSAGNPILIFGRVPMFFYVLHLYVLHGAAELYWRLHYGEWGSHEGGDPRGIGLFGVYAAWLLALLVLYPLCRWYDGVKRRSRSPWLSYL